MKQKVLFFALLGVASFTGAYLGFREGYSYAKYSYATELVWAHLEVLREMQTNPRTALVRLEKQLDLTVMEAIYFRGSSRLENVGILESVPMHYLNSAYQYRQKYPSPFSGAAAKHVEEAYSLVTNPTNLTSRKEMRNE